ncbi:hypothetical protein CAOG_04958 [Capsaspora owczarzaki ATCC 30864]|uniref:Acid ceramidase N-terminal domain-containing protein n=1 Tax=Capsaspora owczarzaki (strain ATCC 30864) TaxID=595528 RepID=A0A0D2WR24_CAPO3|nr:hypothetical protein CAOG_04958 [Capsaspora owczarzaki ATCC 30864]KJE94290.1 hypothetical protein CAOG_004958 [Capsaspora owczarzaki ATCC 30864]|eukprot:XP_004346643.1 hypothetical protein CAOG_04958 [Capsaspora owczarzaki ATCC 30864]
MMKNGSAASLLVVIAAVVAAAASAASAAGVGTNCAGNVNTNTFWSGTPTLVRTVANGTLWSVGDAASGIVQVAHVYGSAYDRGFAHGQLLKDDIQALYPQFFGYLYQQIAPYLKALPKDIQIIIERDGVIAGLEYTFELTKAHTPQRFFDEMQGLADGSGIPYKQVINLHMFPELIKAACSMMGSWGPAIAKTNGTVFQLRALDWGTDSPLTNYPLLLVSHPQAGDGNEFASLAWKGFIGSITGYSHKMGVSEKVWAGYNETSSRAGIPFHFLLRDIAQYDRSLSDAINRMVNNPRTCAIFVGIGSSHDNQFRACEYSNPSLNVFDDVNYPTYANHPLMEGLVFVDKHVQPSNDPCMTSLVTANYGQLDAETIIRQVIGPFQTGDLHAAAYDFGNNVMYIGVASNTTSGVVVPAYARPFLKLDMSQILAQQLVEL